MNAWLAYKSKELNMIELDQNKNTDDEIEKLKMILDAVSDIPKNQELKLRWYTTESYIIVALYDYPIEILKEVEAPQCKYYKFIATKLLGHGGNDVAIYKDESPEENLLYVLGGVLMPAENIRMHCGDPNKCHENVSRLWLANMKKYRIVSGFAMDDNKRWIAHSWLIDKKGCINETASGFLLYYGAIMDDKSAAIFANRHQQNN
jgi:hypothetical protein